MRLKSLYVITAVATAVLASPAAAQLASNSNAPVDITADELEVASNACTSIWRGNAEALQDQSRLRADVLTATFKSKGAAAGGGQSGGGCSDLIRLEGKGAVYYVTPDQKVHGDNIVYDAANETITVTGDVVAVQGQNVLRGNRMVFNTVTGQGQMQGVASGRNKAGRPRGVFYPKSTNAPASSRR